MEFDKDTRLVRLAVQQKLWSQQTFGSDDERGPIGPLKHLIKEAKEAMRSPSDPEEYADCFLLVIDAARRAGFDIEDLLKAAEGKFMINTVRKWNAPLNNEPVHHVK